MLAAEKRFANAEIVQQGFNRQPWSGVSDGDAVIGSRSDIGSRCSCKSSTQDWLLARVPPKRFKSRDPSTLLQQASGRSGFRLSAPAPRCVASRRQSASKCNEALSRDLWPLDPFESAPMRATSSSMGYCILCAIQLLLEIKDLAELLSGKAGSNSLPLKKLLCGFFLARAFLPISLSNFLLSRNL